MPSIRINRFYEVPERKQFVLVCDIEGDIQPGDFIRMPFPGKPNKRFNVEITRIAFSSEEGETEFELHVRAGPELLENLKEISFIGETFQVEAFKESDS